MRFVYLRFSEIWITKLSQLLLQYVLFTNITLISFDQSVSNYYVAKFVLEETSLKNGTDSVPKT
jgi:hypothetical protein